MRAPSETEMQEAPVSTGLRTLSADLLAEASALAALVAAGGDEPVQPYRFERLIATVQRIERRIAEAERIERELRSREDEGGGR